MREAAVPDTSIYKHTGLPRKLAHYTPDYFLVVDSGATVHVLWESVCAAYTKGANPGVNSHRL
jgi:hypothetical protein